MKWRIVTYWDFEIIVQQHMKIKRLCSFILDLQGSLQTIWAECDAIDKPKLVWPGLAEFLGDHARGQSKVQLDCCICFVAQRFRRRFTQELPVGRTRETVLRETGGGMVWRRGTEYLENIIISKQALNRDLGENTYRENNRNSAPNSL